MGYVPSRKEVWEIIELVCEIKSRKDKIKFLRDNKSPALLDVLRGAYDDTIVFNLPEGKPPYTPNSEESYPTTLHKVHMQFGFFVKGGPGDKLPNWKKESKFLSILEGIHPKDAELLVTMIEKKQLKKGLTKRTVMDAFPKLIKK